MNKTQIKFKENISRYDLINVINTIVDIVIYKDMDGAIQYKPYDKDFAFDIGVASFLLDGVQIDDATDIYEFIYSNKEIVECLDVFKTHAIHRDNKRYIESMSDDMIEFKKQEYTYVNDELTARLLKALELEERVNEASLELAQKQSKLLEQQIKAGEYEEKIAEQMSPEDIVKLNQMYLSGEIDAEKMVDQVLNKYLNSEIHNNKVNELIEEKNKQIVELSEFKKKYESRNVLADGK